MRLLLRLLSSHACNANACTNSTILCSRKSTLKLSPVLSSEPKAEDEPDIASKLNALQYRHGTSLKDRTQTLLDDVLLLLPGLLLVCFRAYTGHLWYHSDRLYKEGYFHVKRK